MLLLYLGARSYLGMNAGTDSALRTLPEAQCRIYLNLETFGASWRIYKNPLERQALR